MIEKLKNEDGTIEAIVEIKPAAEKKEEAVEEVVETKKSKPFLPYIWILVILFFLYFVGSNDSSVRNTNNRSPNTSPSKIITE